MLANLVGAFDLLIQFCLRRITPPPLHHDTLRYRGSGTLPIGQAISRYGREMS